MSVEITPFLLAIWKARTQALMDILNKPDELWWADLENCTVMTAADNYHVCTCDGQEEAAFIACFSPPNVMAMFRLIATQALEIDELRSALKEADSYADYSWSDNPTETSERIQKLINGVKGGAE